MSGSSHSAKIFKSKMATDVAKGAAWDKLLRQIQFSAKEKGGDPHTNIALEQLITKAKSLGLQKTKVELAIDKGLGKIAGPPMEQRLYEAFHHGVSLVIDALTDSDQRTANQLRTLLERNHATLAPRNACTINFQRVVEASLVLPTEDAALDLADKLSAIDFEWTKETSAFIVPIETDFRAILGATKIPYQAEFGWAPKFRIGVDAPVGKQVDALVAEIEERDDVQNVSTNHELNS